MLFSDFVQSTTQIINIAAPAQSYSRHELEHHILRLQRELLSVNSIMTHHDAITGTHTWNVGIDYSAMMKAA